MSQSKTSNEIRQEFLDFFRERGHTIVPSASLLPADDPTLYFTNAGMNQFKDVFLGTGTRDYTRVADTQKCMRVSGKHNDLEDVGKDHHHHTFFEMLGNWSFGDYYKEDAIRWSWELLTEVWGLPKDRLHATVFHDDDESYEIWKQYVLDESYISRHGHKDNFWEMGDTGPCGPCTEIHFDLGQEFTSVEDSRPNFDDERFRELWNNVFIQFDRRPDGTLEPLKEKHVDTGMGLNRIVSVLQGKTSNYETDLFSHYIAWVEKESGVPYDRGPAGMPHRVIADHLRAVAFAITDGVTPNNEHRGYVVRRILRRAARYGKKIGLDKPFLYRMVPVLVDQMGAAFPEIGERQKTVTEMIQSEEERFSTALEKGMSHFTVEVEKLEGAGAKEVSGEVTFDLYTTHGFPMDLTRLLAEERGLRIDEARFEELLASFKEQSKGDGFQADDAANKAAEGQPATEFKGYETLSWEAKVLKVAALGDQRRECYLVTDATPCYAESGGQASDRATFMSGGFRGELVHCAKVGDVFLHRLRVHEGWPAEGQDVMIQVDPVARTRAARNHTATHLLHAALHKVLGKHATQAGSLVAPDRLRFDFVNPRAVQPGELAEIEHLVNEQIDRDVALGVATMSRAEADSKGAMAMFGEKYGDVVRVVEVPEFSVELCGGTHVDRTGQIQRFKILGESSAAANVRRVEALSGPALFDHLSDRAARLEALSGALNAPPDELLARVEAMQNEIRTLKKDLTAARKQGAGLDATQVVRDAQDVPGKGYRLATAAVEGLTVPDLRDLSDVVLAQLGRGVVVLATSHEGKVNFVVKVAKDLVSDGVHAGNLIREVAAVAGGRGGGRPEMATAGASDVAKIPEALAKAHEVLAT